MAVASDSLDAFGVAVQEVSELQKADPTPLGSAPVDPERTRVIGRASVVLLSSHFERYIYSINEEATTVLNSTGLLGYLLPELLKLLHSRESVESLLETGWDKRGEKLRQFVQDEAWLWSNYKDGRLEHERLLAWMKAPTPKNLIRYYRYWNIDDIFRAITRAVHTRTDLRLKLEELVRKRNNIAHGDPSTEATQGDIESYRDATLRFCERADHRLSVALKRITTSAAPW
jgi:RiboL-PSP-HEPN